MRMWLAGHLMSLSLRAMPAGRAHDMLLDAIDAWYRAFLAEHGYNQPSVRSFQVTRRFRGNQS